ncbi:LysR family transcriptional regulator [Mucilaginibacter achroorhodeus]|uniref:LysR family transcriptional regulator n=1 Tax=Mucilaginibacter achroorhodeus TaxID=2599294 RepID=A0A563U0S1_9SPHI|nr:LysR substrate-binding domain-containing protein [Mucilaginibacter achroorhodeus]TWR24980.1 LysR family transcriptional regulator [Mucilaginibacter achroorhodeus]
MELRQLKYFIKAAELHNFTEAANQLFISQSTLSQQIKQLEDELGILLFDRIGKRVRLTEGGHLFLPYAQRTAKDAEDGRNILKDLMNLQTGTLTIGVTYGLIHVLTKAIVDFSEKIPGVTLEIGFGTTKELLIKLADGNIDLMLSFLPVQQSATYISEKLFSSCLALIVHQDHPCAKNQHLSLKKLETLPLILPSTGYSIRDFFNKMVSKHQVSLNVRMEVNDINMLLQLVNTGKWCTVLMGSSVSQFPDLKAIKITGETSRDATITWPANTYRKKAADVLANMLKRYAQDYHISKS